MQTDRFDYQLPEELIAQEPAEPRDAARMLVCRIASGQIEHRRVRDLPDFLGAGDLVVRNRTQVIPARLLARKRTGGRTEVLLVHPLEAPDTGPCERWVCMIRGRVRPDSELLIDGGDPALPDPVPVRVAACHADGTRTVIFPEGCSVLALCERLGRVPLPPYIRREATDHDRERYQTVFASNPGSVAAPTASLHLTEALLDRPEQTGCRFADI
ncbi:MAG: S-adenosylmethionine:tRNA ribosyltransferase-isomerase, partial [Planctomycetota bacterium]